MATVGEEEVCRGELEGARGGCKEEDDNVRFGDFTAVIMKNVVFWDIKTQFVLHRRHITYPLQSSAS
jgi:hypothetical protein